MAHRFLRDQEADAWERSDFPILCNSCLGDNPYTKNEFDKECKICTRPFTVFRWRPGRNARYKKTEICQTCSKLKNVCQVCVLDLEYGLPVQVRDSALAIDSSDSIPRSNVNREYFAEECDRRARMGIDYESSYGKAPPSNTIQKFQRTTPYYNRNRPPPCTFYARGICNRGVACPYPHEMPVTWELSRQNIKDRFYGVNDPVAAKLLKKAGEMPSLAPPGDESIKSLYIGGLDTRVTEQDLIDNFYSYGEIECINFLPSRPYAFVNYKTREGAEKAAEDLSNNLIIKGLRLKILWGKSQVQKAKFGSQDDEASRQVQPQPMSYFNIPPPPSANCYPSMDPQRMGALVPSQEGCSNGPSITSYTHQGMYHPY